MDDARPTLIILLSMHRSGSSLTACLLQRLGMSLGPFELNGAASTNPYGHFESMPFMMLNRKVQNLAFSFTEDFPESDDVLARFLQSRGNWGSDVRIPNELVEEGRTLVRALVDSGKVSGFKDPRTILTWPFWQEVLKGFGDDVRVVPFGLIRSPHAIAMSLVSRWQGRCGYWTSLDIAAVHLRRQKAILANQEHRLPNPCFGSPSYLETLEVVARYCDLSWDPEAVNDHIDPSCIHHIPARVPHEAQTLFDSLSSHGTVLADSERDRTQFEIDARRIESMRLNQLRSDDEQISIAHQQIQALDAHARELEQRGRDFEQKLEAEEQAARAHLDRIHALTSRIKLLEENLEAAQGFSDELRRVTIVQHAQSRELNERLASPPYLFRAFVRESLHTSRAGRAFYRSIARLRPLRSFWRRVGARPDPSSEAPGLIVPRMAPSEPSNVVATATE
jgi:hypothetical protein